MTYNLLLMCSHETSYSRHAQEKPQIDEVESRLRTAINLQETGALLKAIKLAKRWGSQMTSDIIR